LLTLNHTLVGNSLILVLANILAIEPLPRVRPPNDVSYVQFSNILSLLPVSCPKSFATLTKDLQLKNILDVSILEDIYQSLGTYVTPVFIKAFWALERLGQPSNSPSGIDVILVQFSNALLISFSLIQLLNKVSGIDAISVLMNVTYANLFAYLKMLGGNSVKSVLATVKAAPSSKSTV